SSAIWRRRSSDGSFRRLKKRCTRRPPICASSTQPGCATRSTSCAASCATLADITDTQTPTSPLGRLTRAPLWIHALALAIVLAAMVPIIGTQSFFSADEGAAVAQANLLSDGDGWTQAHPFPAADPSGVAYPIELSERRGDAYAPFV